MTVLNTLSRVCTMTAVIGLGRLLNQDERVRLRNCIEKATEGKTSEEIAQSDTLVDEIMEMFRGA